MVAKTVKPPFCESRLPWLSARLKKNWLVALLGSEPNLAIAIVPRVLTGGWVAGAVGAGGNSFLTDGPVATGVIVVGAAASVKPPPWSTKPEARRWKIVLLKRPLLT